MTDTHIDDPVVIDLYRTRPVEFAKFMGSIDQQRLTPETLDALARIPADDWAAWSHSFAADPALVAIAQRTWANVSLSLDTDEAARVEEAVGSFALSADAPERTAALSGTIGTLLCAFHGLVVALDVGRTDARAADAVIRALIGPLLTDGTIWPAMTDAVAIARATGRPYPQPTPQPAHDANPGAPIFGGTGGALFDDTAAGHGRVTHIQLWAGWDYIHGLQVGWRDGDAVRWGTFHGKQRGQPVTIELASDEMFERIEGRVGMLVDNLSFTTTRNFYGPWGGDGGTGFIIEPRERRAYLLGFRGRSGDGIDAIAAVFEE